MILVTAGGSLIVSTIKAEIGREKASKRKSKDKHYVRGKGMTSMMGTLGQETFHA